jgi:hypothetical protein
MLYILIMKMVMIMFFAASLVFSCTKKSKYNCVVVTNTGFGAGVLITTEHTYRGTYEQMLAHEAKGTTENKTTTCH